MKTKSRSALQIEEYLNHFVKKVAHKQTFATLKNAEIKSSIYPKNDLIVILSESEVPATGEKIDIDSKLSIPINSDLYHSYIETHQMLKSICRIIGRKHTPIIQVTDCPDRPRVEINIASDSKETSYADIKITVIKTLPDHLIRMDTPCDLAPVFEYLHRVENKTLTIETYIQQNGQFASELQWLLDFKEFSLTAGPWSADVMLEKNNQNKTQAIIYYDDIPGNTDEIQYPIPIPASLCDLYLLESITEADKTLDNIKNTTVKIIRNDENIILLPYGDEDYPFAIR